MTEFVRFQELDEAHRKQVTEAFERGEMAPIVASNISYFKDDVKRVCAHCGKELVLRPWMAELARKHEQKIICLTCAMDKLGKKGMAKAIDQSYLQTVENWLRDAMHRRGIA